METSYHNLAILWVLLLFGLSLSFVTNQLYNSDPPSGVSSAWAQNGNGNLSHSGSRNNSFNNQHIQYYACTDYEDVTHCDPSLVELTSFLVRGISSEVYVPSANLTFLEGKYGNALKLVADRRESIEIKNTMSINPQNFSVTFWAKRLPLSEPRGIIVSHTNDTNTAGWNFYMSGKGNVSFAVTNSDGNVTYTEDNGDAVISRDDFTLIAGTFDGTKVRLYKDGKLVSEAIFGGQYIPDPRTPLRIGGLASSMGTLLWTGVIDNLSLYGRTLTENEIKELYQRDTTAFSFDTTNYMLTEDLLSTWKLDKDLDETSFVHRNNNDGIARTVIASMVFAPDGRLFFSEKNTGNIRIMKDDKVLEKPFATTSDHYVDSEQGLLGLAIDPLFEKNHYVYLYYTAINKDSKNNTIDNKIVNKVVRFTDVNNTAYDKVTLLDNIPAMAGYHSGGALAFGPDDKLYITVGDATSSIFAQNPSVLLGKVLRINRDGTIPADNPYPGSPVYTIGHRNMYGIAFDKDGFGIISENGDVFYDEINALEKGGNYGYPTLQPPNASPMNANASLSILPLRTYWRTIAPTQAVYYEGSDFPELKNRFLVGGFDGNIYALLFDTKDSKKIAEEVKIAFKVYPYSAITAIAAAPDGDIYFAGSAIYKLTKIDSSQKEQIVYPLELDFSSEFSKIKGIEIPKGENKILINFQTSNQEKNETSSLSLSSPHTLSIKIPKKLLDEISSVANATSNTGSYNNDNNISNSTRYLKPIPYTVDNSSSYFNIITVKYWPSMTYLLEIIGADVGTVISNNTKVVALNFDDSYKSQIQYAKPILDKYGFKGTFFEVCGRISEKGWQDIFALQQDGMDIQSHTMTHPLLDELSKAELNYEIGQAKQCFLNRGINTTIFAYPYGVGADNKTVVHTVAKNYDLARTDSAYPLTFLTCDIWKEQPTNQTDCRTNDNDENLTLANRYSINSLSHKHITGPWSYDTMTCIDDTCSYYNNSQMFERFVEAVNIQNKYNKGGIIRAIAIIVYHSFVPLNDVSESKIPVDTSVNLFDAEMKYLHENGFKVLTMADLSYDENSNYMYIKK
jgi:glucose/arabinose dehydrogenase/peptidoglycan/xylan/chitin deacetylase (PgdA/CDA1 family)